MAISQLLAVTFLGLVAISRVSASCSTCLIQHPQQKFCDADVVFKVRPVSYRWVDAEGNEVIYSSYAHDVEYKIKVEAVFRGHERLPQGQKIVYIYSPRNLCNIDKLEMGVRYLISSKMRGDKMEVTTCGLVKKWAEVTATQRRGLRGGYQSMCSRCRIFGSNVMRYYGGNAVIDEMSSGLWTRQECFYNPIASLTYGSDDCETLHSFCMPQKNGECAWEGKAAFDECFRQREYKWQLMKFAELGRFAWTCPEQCKDLTPKRLKYKCKKATWKLPPCEGSRDTVREFPAPSKGAGTNVGVAQPTLTSRGVEVRTVDPNAVGDRGLEGVAPPEIIDALSPMLDEQA